MLSKKQINRLDESCEDILKWPESTVHRMQFNERANPQTVREIIAMLRESQKDAAQYRFWRNHTLAAISGSTTDYIDQTIDAAMQRDCDGAQHANQDAE